jgi:endonuclease/exonuclease/phosphatase (EEP) superfamily protein YafD
MIAQLLLIIVLVGSFAGFLGYRSKYCELTSHFKLQWLILAGLCWLMFSVAQVWSWSLLAFIGMSINLAVILPWYMPSRRTQARRHGRLRLLFANVDWKNVDHARCLEFVQEVDPDVVMIQEATQRWIDALKILTDRFPYSKTEPHPGGWGMALYSRIPLDECEVIYLGADRRPTIRAQLRLGTGTLWLVGVHPRAPLRRNDFHHRNEHLREAATVIRRLPAPKIMVGDFNCSLWSPHYTRLVRETGLVNARQGFGLFPTWPTYMPLRPFSMLPIDHCLVSPDIRVVHFQTGRNIGSDHLPLLVDLAIPVPTPEPM